MYRLIVLYKQSGDYQKLINLHLQINYMNKLIKWLEKIWNLGLSIDPNLHEQYNYIII